MQGESLTPLLGAAVSRDLVGEARATRRIVSSVLARPRETLDIGRYRVFEAIGRGASGIVYRGHDPELARDVAIKVMPVPRRGDPRRQLAEARAVARLRHPNVVAVHDAGLLHADALASLAPDPECASGVYIVMELVSGRDLRAWLKEETRSWRAIVGALVDAAQGLEAAHSAGIVHRDFKPANVRVDTDSRVCVLDFGLATGADVPDGSTGSGRPPRREGIVGTPRYMAPEQHLGAQVDARADQYALCVTLFEALHGHPPFRGVTLEALCVAKHGRPRRGPAPIPRRLRAVLARGLAVRADDRFESMAALRRALQAVLAGRHPRRRWFGVAPLVVAASVAAASRMGVADETCPRRGDVLGEAWDGAHRLAAREGFDRAPIVGRERAWSRVSQRLDAFADEWAAQSETACRVEDTARVQCLEGQRAQVEAFATLLADGDASVVQHAVAVAAALPNPDDCGRAGTRRLPPQDAAVARALDHARIQHWAGQHREARVRLDEAAERAAGPWAQAQVAALRCVIDEAEGRVAETAEACRDASRAMEAVGDDAGALDALTSEAVALFRAGRRDPAASVLDVARGKAARLGNHRAARLAIALAELQLSADETDVLRRAARARTLLAPGDEDAAARLLIANRTGLAHMRLRQLSRARRAYGEALQVAQRSFGEWHPRVGLVVNNLAVVDRVAGDHAASLGRFRTALEIKEVAWGAQSPRTITTRINLGRAYLLLGMADRAEDPLRRARTLDARHGGQQAATIDALLAAIPWRRAPDEVACRRVRALADAATTGGQGTASMLRADEGACWLAAGAPQAARVAFAETLAPSEVHPRGRARAWLGLSRVAAADGDARLSAAAHARGVALLRADRAREDMFDALDDPPARAGVPQEGLGDG